MPASANGQMATTGSPDYIYQGFLGKLWLKCSVQWGTPEVSPRLQKPPQWVGNEYTQCTPFHKFNILRSFGALFYFFTYLFFGKDTDRDFASTAPLSKWKTGAEPGWSWKLGTESGCPMEWGEGRDPNTKLFSRVSISKKLELGEELEHEHRHSDTARGHSNMAS